MADEIKSSLGWDTDLIPGSGGVFDVVADGTPIFQKSKTGRFPHEGEIPEILRHP